MYLVYEGNFISIDEFKTLMSDLDQIDFNLINLQKLLIWFLTGKDFELNKDFMVNLERFVIPSRINKGNIINIKIKI